MSVPWDQLRAAIEANPSNKAVLGGGAATVSLDTLPDEIALTWLPGWHEDASFTVSDCVCLSLWVRDPMYRTATDSVRRAMEKEEASFLLHAIDSAWKEHNGRARGWCRKHLEEDLRLRAGGGDAAPDAWESVRLQKRAAQLVDYICALRSLRVGLWWPEHATVTNIPLSSESATIVQVSCTSGRILIGPSGYQIPFHAWKPHMATVKDMQWVVPLCAPSIGAHTVAQIQEKLEAKSVTATGNRAQLWTRLQFESM